MSTSSSSSSNPSNYLANMNNNNNNNMIDNNNNNNSNTNKDNNNGLSDHIHKNGHHINMNKTPRLDQDNSNTTTINNGNIHKIDDNDIKSRLPELSIEQIREKLRQCDPNCDGRLQLTMDDQTGIACLCINSPQRRNAFSGFMMAQFSDILDQLENWKKGKMIIIYGANNFFCSGADLKTIRQNNLSDQCGAYYISRLMHSNLSRLEQLPIVSIALIEGKALGGGAEIITACDFRVATNDAQIGFVHARLGVTPGFGGGTRLIRLIGSCTALQLMLSAKLIDAHEAHRIGLVQHVLEPELSGQEALEATKQWYQHEFGRISSFASRAIKSIVASNQQHNKSNSDNSLQTEANIFCSVWGREEHMKALQSNIKHHK